MAFPGGLLADVVPAEVLATLAVIEQTDDADFMRKRAGAIDEVLSQYGLKREEAYRYSVSSAAALGPMQFTNGGEMAPMRRWSGDARRQGSTRTSSAARRIFSTP